MEKKYCVCTHQANTAGGYTMVVVEKFDTEEDAIGLIESGMAGYADYYWVQAIWFRK